MTTEREKLAERGVEAQITAEEFAAVTPDVPAEHIDCEECDETYIGNPNHEHVCPTCERQ